MTQQGSLAPRPTTGSGHSFLSVEKKFKIIWMASLINLVWLLALLDLAFHPP